MIFRWLYVRRMRALFGQYMAPDAFEQNVAPLLRISEFEAFRALVLSYMPSAVSSRASQDDLVVLKNQINRALSESEPSASRRGDQGNQEKMIEGWNDKFARLVREARQQVLDATKTPTNAIDKQYAALTRGWPVYGDIGGTMAITEEGRSPYRSCQRRSRDRV